MAASAAHEIAALPLGRAAQGADSGGIRVHASRPNAAPLRMCPIDSVGEERSQWYTGALQNAAAAAKSRIAEIDTLEPQWLRTTLSILRPESSKDQSEVKS